VAVTSELLYVTGSDVLSAGDELTPVSSVDLSFCRHTDTRDIDTGILSVLLSVFHTLALR